MNSIQEKKIIKKTNIFFLYYDAALSIICLILTLVFVKSGCITFTFLFYSFFYLFQTGQHYLIKQMPTRDVNKHVVALKRIIGLICFSDVFYLFLAVMFWGKTEAHPLYCGLCVYLHFGLWIGVIVDLHCIFVIFWGINLIHAFITRRYYLLALGGYENEVRMLQERARQQQFIRQPNYNDFPLPEKQKYYRFEDIVDPQQIGNECSICLSKEKKEKFVDAGCGHIFHHDCLENWAKVNSTCPQCRQEFPQK